MVRRQQFRRLLNSFGNELNLVASNFIDLFIRSNHRVRICFLFCLFCFFVTSFSPEFEQPLCLLTLLDLSAETGRDFIAKREICESRIKVVDFQDIPTVNILSFSQDLNCWSRHLMGI